MSVADAGEELSDEQAASNSTGKNTAGQRIPARRIWDLGIKGNHPKCEWLLALARKKYEPMPEPDGMQVI